MSEEITDLEFKNSLKICEEYIRQENNKLDNNKKIIDDIKNSDVLQTWLNLKKGDKIKFLGFRHTNGNVKLKSGDILIVANTIKDDCNDSDFYEYILYVIVKIDTRRYKMTLRKHYCGTFNYDTFFEVI